MRHSVSTGHDPGYRVRSAPYALVRATVLTYPAQSPAGADLRAVLARLADVERESAALVPALGDDLYASRSGHPPAFHRDVVLPLRRALHNGREPRPAVLAALGDLPRRLPRLARWLTLHDRRRALLETLDRTAGPALDAERAALAALCREPALARATALTSADLLRAVQRAGDGTADRRTRKEEPNVLRYALRASTKTSPLSWFTAVGWGPLPEPPDGRPLRRDWGDPGPLDGPLHTRVTVNRTLTSALTAALLDAPHRRVGLPHRVTSTARVTGDRVTYSRSRTVFAGGRYLVTEEDEAELANTGPLGLVTARALHPVTREELAGHLAAALSGAGAGDGRAAAEAFLERLCRAGLLVPTEPVPPQDDDPLGRLTDWLRGLAAPAGAEHRGPAGAEEQGPAGAADGEQPGAEVREPAGAEDRDLADRIDAVARLTAGFGPATAAERPARVSTLVRHWTELLAAAGRPVPPGAAPLNVLSEDVVAPRPARLDGFLDGADHEALAEVTALAELFDLGHLVRRAARDRFVRRYGSGGSCAHPWEFGPETAAAWQDAARIAALDPADRAAFPTGAEEFAALRGELADRVRAAGAGRDTADTDVVLPGDLVKGLGERLPRWAVARPAGYACFLQRDPAAGLLCVNRVYGGWGRFTSRFLDLLDPRAAEAVSRQIHDALGPGARPAQLRPVGGFNANLHPLLVPDEIGPDRRWAPIGEPDLELAHDEAADQLRLRLRGTGEPLDVLYPGFLAPVMLPRRIAAHLSDLPHGMVDFQPLVPRHPLTAPGGRVIVTPRLRHRHVVLLRRRWLLPPGVLAAFVADLTAGPEVPAAAVARWRALLDLPEQVFLHPVAAAPTGRPAEDFLTRLARPKPQFVDLGNALHLRCLAKWLARHPDGAALEEALPAPGGAAAPARAVELVLETYRAARPS
ncbi:lantibiotic dehydratase [Streptomyces pactum]|uniref:Lantibiotic dehydratase n=1 Tax=Streptomyces pactum TaxID=68249 RepID=A0ABS0NSK4_9ACTN|nr:lantibiotic dehydratase [Streptomyces pactum]MBH5338189.1 lantibiotic dehydratase [Streptomyces pactum]